MTKEEEALAFDLALEALEGIHPGNMTPMAEEYWNKAITAIKQARSAPVQEPIGYLFQHDETGLTTVVDVQQVEWGFEKNNPRHQKIGPVYTTPPAAQRQWVGLPDDEIEETANDFEEGYVFLYRSFARAIEAKLKEKNT
jgi:hypothetical protein